MIKIKAGDLRRRITFQQMVESKNSVGEVIQTPEDYLTTYAKIEPVKPLMAKGGQEYLDDQKVRPEITYAVTTRYRPDISTDMFVKYGDRIFQIVGILNLEERDRLMNVICVEKVKEP
jgi:SPP1 family predicted phage head-tail adaptor